MNLDEKEKRKSYRVTFPCEVKLIDVDSSFLARVENISESGVKILSSREIGESKQIELHLFMLENGGFVTCQGSIIWEEERKKLTESNQSKFDIGIKFLEVSDNDKKCIKRIVDKSLEHKAKE